MTLECEMEFKPGDMHYLLWVHGPGKPHKIHILTIVDEHQVVYKWYGRHKQWWHYEIKRDWLLEMEIKRTRDEKAKTD